MAESTGRHQIQRVVCRCICSDTYRFSGHNMGYESCSAKKNRKVCACALLLMSTEKKNTWHPNYLQLPCKQGPWPNFLMRNVLVHNRHGYIFTVNIPRKCFSSSTTKTQSLLLAAINWTASITKIFSFKVNA